MLACGCSCCGAYGHLQLYQAARTSRCLKCKQQPIPNGEETGYDVTNDTVLEEEIDDDTPPTDQQQPPTEDHPDPELTFKLKYEKYDKSDMVTWHMHHNVYTSLS